MGIFAHFRSLILNILAYFDISPRTFFPPAELLQVVAVAAQKIPRAGTQQQHFE